MRVINAAICLAFGSLLLLPGSAFARKHLPEDCPVWDPIGGERGLHEISRNLEPCLVEFSYSVKVGLEEARLRGMPDGEDEFCFSVEFDPDHLPSISINLGHTYPSGWCGFDYNFHEYYENFTEDEIRACMYAMQFLGKVAGEFVCE